MPEGADREVEAKFQVGCPNEIDVLYNTERLTPDFLLTPTQVKTHHDSYYDSSSYQLLRAGFVLRVRESGTSVTVAVKSLMSDSGQSLHDRLELERQIRASGKPPYRKSWPADLRQFVARKIGAKTTLAPIASLYQSRTQRKIMSALAAQVDDQPFLAELSIDEVAVHRPGTDANGSPPTEASASTRFMEIELEANAPKEVFPLHKVAQQLADEYQLQPAPTSKLERALLALHTRLAQDPYSPAGIQVEMHIAEACRLIWREQLMRVLLAEHGVRADTDIEFVHELRVAIRRARAAEKLFGGYFRRSVTKPYFDTYRQLGRLAGAVRDLDIALVNLTKFEQRLPGEQGNDLKAIRRQLLKRRKRAQASLLKWMNTDAYGAFVSDFTQICATPGSGLKKSYRQVDAVAPVQVSHVLPGVVLNCFQHVRAYENLIANPSASARSEERLHALRIECKILRYALEFGSDLMGKSGESVIVQLKRIQDHLGELNDIAVERRRLRTWQAELGDNSALRTRLADLDAQQADLVQSFPARYLQFVDEENRRTLALALAAV